MSNIIDFLERMGSDAELRHARRTEVERALSNAEMSPAARSAIADADRSRLEVLLGASSNVCCLVYAPQKVREESDEEHQKSAAA